ncbi:MAG: pyrroline-5-carboxylate reductase [Planctomycetota bacterium]
MKNSTLPPFAVVGGGNMAFAVLRGAAERGVIDLERCTVADPDENRRSTYPRSVERTEDLIPAIVEAESEPGETAIFLAVKPQKLAAVAEQLRPALLDAPGDRLVISILAGVNSVRVRDELGKRVRVVRAMPNTPAQVGRGMTAICAGAGAMRGDDETAATLFNAIGETAMIEESLFDAYTALAGSGPAYVFYLAEAMRAAGVELGFDSVTADRCVRQTILGAAELLSHSDDPPEELRRRVTSPGGVTAAVTGHFDAKQMQQTIIDAIRAGRDRGRELGK